MKVNNAEVDNLILEIEAAFFNEEKSESCLTNSISKFLKKINKKDKKNKNPNLNSNFNNQGGIIESSKN